MPGRSGGGVNPFRFARTTKTEECFSLKVGEGRNQFSWCHKPGIIFLLFLFPHRHTQPKSKPSNLGEFWRKKKKVVRVMRKRRTSQSAYTFIIFPQRVVLIPHHTEAAAVPVHIYRGKKLNHLNSNNFQIKSKWVMRYSYPIGEDWGGNTAQRVLRS